MSTPTEVFLTYDRALEIPRSQNPKPPNIHIHDDNSIFTQKPKPTNHFPKRTLPSTRGFSSHSACHVYTNQPPAHSPLPLSSSQIQLKPVSGRTTFLTKTIAPSHLPSRSISLKIIPFSFPHAPPQKTFPFNIPICGSLPQSNNPIIICSLSTFNPQARFPHPLTSRGGKSA